MHAMLVTLLYDKEFRITHMEMIKGIKGLGYHDELVVPIIENTAHEADLKESMDQAIKAYPKATAVLVRRHGVYIWGYLKKPAHAHHRAHAHAPPHAPPHKLLTERVCALQ